MALGWKMVVSEQLAMGINPEKHEKTENERGFPIRDISSG